MDFSHAGYKGGGVQIPDVRVARSVKPVAGDNTAHIQAAIDEVSKLPLDANGFRGAVLLDRGSYDIAGTLRIAASGVVLRGSGSGENGTVLRATGTPHRIFTVGGTGHVAARRHSRDRHGFVRARWSEHGYGRFCRRASRRRSRCHSARSNRRVDPVHEHGHAHARRQAADVARAGHDHHARSNDQINRRKSRDVRRAAGGFVRRGISEPARHNSGELHIPRPNRTGRHRVPAGGRAARRTNPSAKRNLRCFDERGPRRLGAGRGVRRHAQQHNVRVDGAAESRSTGVHIQHTLPFTAPAAPADFAISGTQILLDRSSVTGQGVWPVVTQVGVMGPNVVLNFKSTTAGIAPHQRWAPGCSSTAVSSPAVRSAAEHRFSNREHAGSGHGWSVGWAVAWNVKAEVLLIQQPPGAKNWCIGCTGRFTPILWHKGVDSDSGEPVRDARVSRCSCRARQPVSLAIARPPWRRKRCGTSAANWITISEAKWSVVGNGVSDGYLSREELDTTAREGLGALQVDGAVCSSSSPTARGRCRCR